MASGLSEANAVAIQADGAPDGAFNGGWIAFAPKRIDIRAVATSVAIVDGRRIVVAGGKDGASNTGLVVAYRGDGHFDRTFGRQGFIPMPGLFPLSMVRDRCGRLAFAAA